MSDSPALGYMYLSDKGAVMSIAGSDKSTTAFITSVPSTVFSFLAVFISVMLLVILILVLWIALCCHRAAQRSLLQYWYVASGGATGDEEMNEENDNTRKEQQAESSSGIRRQPSQTKSNHQSFSHQLGTNQGQDEHPAYDAYQQQQQAYSQSYALQQPVQMAMPTSSPMPIPQTYMMPKVSAVTECTYPMSDATPYRQGASALPVVSPGILAQERSFHHNFTEQQQQPSSEGDRLTPRLQRRNSYVSFVKDGTVGVR